jgi:hypothetical protein
MGGDRPSHAAAAQRLPHGGQDQLSVGEVSCSFRREFIVSRGLRFARNDKRSPLVSPASGRYAGCTGIASHGSGASASVNQRKSKTERAARRKGAVSPTQAMIEPPPAPPMPAPDSLGPENVPSHSANGDDETALARLADDGAPPPPPAEIEPPPAPVLSLEDRVRRLEDALAVLQGQRAAEPPVVAPPPVPPPQAVFVPSPPVPPPPSPPSTAVLVDVGKRFLGVASQVVPPAEHTGILWLLWDTWAEARAIVRMFVDPRYHLPWSARVLPLVVLGAILTSKYWIPGSSIPIVGDWLLVKLVDLLLAFLLFKWLGHEARRYRRTSPDLPSSLRL